jgi:hypothetical protein
MDPDSHNSPKLDDESSEDIIEIKKRVSIKEILSSPKKMNHDNPEEPDTFSIKKENVEIGNQQVQVDFSKPSDPTEPDKLIPLIKEKFEKISRYYNFSVAYVAIITKIFRIYYQPLIKRLSNTLDQNKRIIKFFKEITSAYQRFSADLMKANLGVNEINQDQIFSNNMNAMIEKTQETIAGNFMGFSKVLQSNIVQKGPLAKIDEFYKRLSKIDKDILANLNKLQIKKEKIEKLFTIKHNKLFEQLNQFYKEIEKVQDKQKLNQILYKNDFFIIEMEIMGAFKGLNESVNEFFNLLKSQLKSAVQLTSDYLNIIQESMEIYVGENKKIFSDIKMESFKKFYDGVSESLESNFIPKNIVTDPEMLISFNQGMKDYQMNFFKHDITIFKDASQNEILKSEDNFKIQKFKTIEEFADFFIAFKPESIEGYYNSNLKEIEIEIKRDPGIFSSWKNSILIITKQKNILVFDEEGSNLQYIDILSIDRLKVKIKEDKKNPYRLEISESKKGFMFDTSTSFKIDCLTKEKYELIVQIICISPESYATTNSTDGNISQRKNTEGSQKQKDITN